MTDLLRLTKAQIQRLILPRPAHIFEEKRGMTYIPTHEVKAEMTRVFGPTNWDHTIHDVEMLYETKLTKGMSQFPRNGADGAEYWVVGYRVACTIRVRSFDGVPLAETTEYHAEENAPLPNRGEAHAMALTSAESYAFRRAALDFGDAFGLHLYDKGSKASLIKGTLLLSERYPEPKEEDKKDDPSQAGAAAE